MTEDTLPDSPPPLHEQLALTDRQVRAAHEILEGLTETLKLAAVLAQDGTMITAAGTDNADVIERLTRLAGRVWREGATRIARELIRFEEETIGDEDGPDRINLMLYSTHVAGAVTLTLGWDLSIPLTQVRAEIAEIKDELVGILRSNG